MNETQFKILIHSGVYVDISMLQKGIYSTSKPVLYNKEETIESLIERCKAMTDLVGHNFFSDTYIENLRQCVFAEVSIIGEF